jgi:hypothetical protein
MWLAYTLLVACAPGAFETVSSPAQVLSEGANVGTRAVEIALDRGRMAEGTWVSEAGDDALIEPVAAQVNDRAVAMLTEGAHRARVARSCGVVYVPFFVGADTAIVSLPYPACGEHGPDGVWSPEDVDVLRALDLLPDLPASEGVFAAWMTFDEAVAACAWYGRELPGPASSSPIGVWLHAEDDAAAGTARVVGGDWATPASLPAVARDHQVGLMCGA